MDKKEIVRLLEEMGTLLELQGANPFKSRAFHNASRTLEGVTEDLAVAVESGSIRKVKGIGEGIARVITDLVRTGTSKDYDEVRGKVPDGVLAMLRIQGLGPKKVKILYEKLKIDSVDGLEQAAAAGKLATLEGFGKKTEENILAGIRAVKSRGEKVLYPVAAGQAQHVLAAIGAMPGVIRSSLCGSLRRHKEVIGDIDVLVSAEERHRAAIMDRFVTLPGISRVISRGDTKSTVELDNTITCDLRVVADAEFPFAQNYFTGSKEHNVEMRSRARKIGLSLNEYAFSPIEGAKKTRIPKVKTEEDIYGALDLAYIPPELRENTREFEAAEKDAIPALIEEQDLRGTFHCHTTYSDGVNSLEQMVSAARTLGWEYLGIADHSQAAAYAGGLTHADVVRQVKEIDAVNAALRGFTVFKGTECDILPDGSLDWPEKTLALFDYVVVSIHSNFRMTEAQMTKRIITALKHPRVTVLGHPTGRLLLSREPYPVDMLQVIQAAADHGKAIEINAHPMRLDLDWRLVAHARDLGVRIFINPDAHSVDGLRDTFYGVGIARKGWLRSADVVNTGSTAKVRTYLAQFGK
jgi:DNA polymerase (family X)